MTDNLARTIATLRAWRESTARNLCWWEKVEPGSISPDDLLAICDAAERGMRADQRTSGTTHWGDCWRYTTTSAPWR